MIRRLLISKNGILAIILLAVIVSANGCSALQSKKKPTASTTGSVQSVGNQDASIYHDFGDVLLPRELKVDMDDTFIFRTPGLTAGVMSLDGRVKVDSLVTFFENKMPVDGWRQVSSFKAPRTMMLFSKHTRWCVISISEGRFSTNVKIWVAPALEDAQVSLPRG